MGNDVRRHRRTGRVRIAVRALLDRIRSWLSDPAPAPDMIVTYGWA